MKEEGERGGVSGTEVGYRPLQLVLLHHISLSHLLPSLSVKYLLRWKAGRGAVPSPNSPSSSSPAATEVAVCSRDGCPSSSSSNSPSSRPGKQ